jgi:hypothetical protein
VRNSNLSQTAGKWPLERALFAMAGTVTLLSAALAAFVSPWFLLLTAFVGLNQWAYVAVHKCPASLIMKNGFGLCSVVYPDDAQVEKKQTATPGASDREAVAR